MSEEITNVLLLLFSYAVYYGFITIDTQSVSVEIKIKSLLSDTKRKEIWNNLRKQHISNIDADSFL